MLCKSAHFTPTHCAAALHALKVCAGYCCPSLLLSCTTCLRLHAITCFCPWLVPDLHPCCDGCSHHQAQLAHYWREMSVIICCPTRRVCLAGSDVAVNDRSPVHLSCPLGKPATASKPRLTRQPTASPARALLRPQPTGAGHSRPSKQGHAQAAQSSSPLLSMPPRRSSSRCCLTCCTHTGNNKSNKTQFLD